MVVRNHPALSLSRQCRPLSIGRSSPYCEPKGENAEILVQMRRIDELFLKYPFYGASRDGASPAPPGRADRTPATWLATRASSLELRRGSSRLPWSPMIETENSQTTWP